MINKAVDKYKNLILDTFDYITKNPETGYKEVKSSKCMERAFESLGYTLTKAGDIPGFYTVIDTGREGPELLILGELDSLICREHPDADKQTGAVHVCGHNAQSAALVGVAAALTDPDILSQLSGRIRLCAVPAEELIEIEYRNGLKNQGKIKYLGGKQEYLYRGYFDGVDLAFMVHTTGGDGFMIIDGGVGFISKTITYKGVSAHAGGSPWSGTNALYAANLGLSAANAIRETFKESDIIRFHPVITNGGGAVNAIPDNVVVESYVRGKTFEGIKSANERINRALCGAALSLGANVDIEDFHGYSPLTNAKGMIEVAAEAAGQFEEVPLYRSNSISSGSTDMGDLSVIMPVVHPYAPGAIGKSHGKDYYVNNPELACILSAKWQVAMLTILLKDGAKRAKQIVSEFEPMFKTKQEYFDYVDALSSSGDRITYTDGAAQIKL